MGLTHSPHLLWDGCVPPLTPLPVDALLPELTASLRAHPNLVLVAEPGAGKTTRVPAALLDALPGQILVLEPRRIAARMAARRVAAERGEEPGQSVGYQVRMERVSGPGTRLHFLTEGVLVRRLFSDPTLEGVSCVILDEFHERHLETDLALTLLRRLQQSRPALHLIVMSATLDAAPVAGFLGSAPILRSSGRLFPLAIEHLPYSPAPLEQQVTAALDQLLCAGETGNILVFLPGAAEINRTLRAAAEVSRRMGRLLLPLHGSLPPAEQDRAIAPTREPKIILATNVAESSVTIDGVTAVIDSGLARIAESSPWTGLPTLRIGRISKASARQRAGRAGRTAPGRVLRLFPQMDFEQREEQERPEILRGDLAQLSLALRAMGINKPTTLDWLDAPPVEALAQAEALLSSLGAEGPRARQMMRLPLHPRLARMIDAALQAGVGRAACRVAALLATQARTSSIDLLEALDKPLDERARREFEHLTHLVHPPRNESEDDDALLRSLLAGFPDRVAQRKSGQLLMLANGIPAAFAAEPPRYPLLLALDVEDRTEKAQPLVRLCARMEAEWLLDLFPERMRDESLLAWNRSAERVDQLDRLCYESLILEESSGLPRDPEAASQLLAEKALEAGIERFTEADKLAELLGRIAFAGEPAPDWPTLLGAFCLGSRSFADLRSAGLLAWLEGRYAHTLHQAAPATLRLARGRQVRIHYENGKEPWVASRLQDFFGMSDTPRIGPHRRPVVLHLLAPNQRAVQTTTDLAGFWTRLYPSVRRELMRRYPRHSWPEDPLA